MFLRHRRGLRNTLLVATGTLVVTATMIVPATPGLAESPNTNERAETVQYTALPSGFTGWGALFAEQNRLDAVATQILASRNEPGYAGIYVAPESHRVDVYWHGQVPDRVAAVAREAAVPVSVHAAAYSAVDLAAQQQVLIGQPDVMRVAPKTDASGLEVTVSPSAVSRTTTLQRLVAAPITVTTGSATRPMSLGKQDDSPPYWGAARIQNEAGAGCSSGFAVKYLGQPHMVTAAHCGFGTASAYWDGNGDFIGASDMADKGRDVTLIKASTGPAMYTGNYNSSSRRFVSGAQYALPGNYVCRSSSYSNAVCGLKVINWTVAVQNIATNGQPYTIFPVAQAEDLNHQADATGNGDSGGSMYTPDASADYATARGIVSAADIGNVVPCTGEPETATRACHWRVYFVDISWILENNNATIMAT